jgi:hypothetical protein
VLALLGIFSQTMGTWAMTEVLSSWGVNRWFGLIYGTWVGFLLAIIVGLPEPLAYGFVATGILALIRDKEILGWFMLGLAVFAKEVTLVFVIALFVTYIYERKLINAIGLSLFTFFPYGLFQIWLWYVFGQPGIGTGGDMATSFEWIPFMGFFRIGAYSLGYMFAMLVVFGPTILWPTVWGLFFSIKYWLSRHRNMVVLALFFNSIMVTVLPFSTFRETGGLLRIASGFVLAVILFAGYFKKQRVLNYCLIWVVLNVFLIKS